MLKVTHIIITQNTERTSQFKVVDTWEQRFEEVFFRKDITQRYRREEPPTIIFCKFIRTIVTERKFCQIFVCITIIETTNKTCISRFTRTTVVTVRWVDLRTEIQFRNIE